MPSQFSDLGISKDLQKSLDELQITEPTTIQKKCIPLILEKKDDLVALAKTGTGKTAAFGLPLLQMINSKSTAVQAIIL
ncbi:MAG: DEAD/DEAH box helicase, partial [Maribacter dokdonensis]